MKYPSIQTWAYKKLNQVEPSTNVQIFGQAWAGNPTIVSKLDWLYSYRTSESSSFEVSLGKTCEEKFHDYSKITYVVLGIPLRGPVKLLSSNSELIIATPHR